MHLYLSGICFLVLKNGHHKGTCHNEVGLCVQNEDVILSSIVKIIGKTYGDRLKKKNNLHFDLL
jgi:hypothetical protein